jgi:hypothetical protein
MERTAVQEISHAIKRLIRTYLDEHPQCGIDDEEAFKEWLMIQGQVFGEPDRLLNELIRALWMTVHCDLAIAKRDGTEPSSKPKTKAKTTRVPTHTLIRDGLHLVVQCYQEKNPDKAENFEAFKDYYYRTCKMPRPDYLFEVVIVDIWAVELAKWKTQQPPKAEQ